MKWFNFGSTIGHIDWIIILSQVWISTLINKCVWIFLPPIWTFRLNLHWQFWTLLKISLLCLYRYLLSFHILNLWNLLILIQWSFHLSLFLCNIKWCIDNGFGSRFLHALASLIRQGIIFHLFTLDFISSFLTSLCFLSINTVTWFGNVGWIWAIFMIYFVGSILIFRIRSSLLGSRRQSIHGISWPRNWIDLLIMITLNLLGFNSNHLAVVSTWDDDTAHPTLCQNRPLQHLLWFTFKWPSNNSQSIIVLLIH